MIKTIKTKQFKITALVLALVLTVSCVMMNATKAHALEITGANTEGYTILGGGTLADGKLTNASIGVYVTGGSADKYNGENIQWTHDGSGWDSKTDVLYEGANSQQILIGRERERKNNRIRKWMRIICAAAITLGAGLAFLLTKRWEIAVGALFFAFLGSRTRK